MEYRAKNIDVNKALAYLEDTWKYEREKEREEIMKVQEYYRGVRYALSLAENMFKCSNYERTETTDYQKVEEPNKE